MHFFQIKAAFLKKKKKMFIVTSQNVNYAYTYLKFFFFCSNSIY